MAKDLLAYTFAAAPMDGLLHEFLELLETPYVSGSRVREILTFLDPGAGESDVNTTAGTHDNVNATLDAATDNGDFAGTGPNLNYAVDYFLTTAVTSGGIRLARVTMKQSKRSVNAAGGSGAAQPYIAGVSRGTPDGTDTGTSFVDLSFPFTADPGDGLPWTTTKVNAQRWGFRIAWTTGDDTDTVICRVSEFVVELWGVPATFPAQFLGLKAFFRGVINDLCLVASADRATGLGATPLVQKGATTYAIYLVETSDTNASPIRIQTSAGTKAIRLKT